MTQVFTSLVGSQTSKEEALENPARRENNQAKKTARAADFCRNLCS